MIEACCSGCPTREWWSQHPKHLAVVIALITSFVATFIYFGWDTSMWVPIGISVPGLLSIVLIIRKYYANRRNEQMEMLAHDHETPTAILEGRHVPLIDAADPSVKDELEPGEILLSSIKNAHPTLIRRYITPESVVIRAHPGGNFPLHEAILAGRHDLIPLIDTADPRVKDEQVNWAGITPRQMAPHLFQ